MSGRKLNAQQRNALYTLRHRDSGDLRALKDTDVSEAEMEDLVSDGYASIANTGAGSGRRSWRLTAKGRTWVDRNL